MENGKDRAAIHATIFGRVQGVGFRYNTRREASRRNLTGWVRNLPDGSVEVECEGEKARVEAFAGWLKKGPPGAHVSDVELRRIPYRGIYNRFTVEF